VLGHQRRHDIIPVGAVNAVDLGGDLERQAGASRDLDGAVRPLLRRDPAEEREIAPSGVTPTTWPYMPRVLLMRSTTR
jgi:hypothetical protein